MARTDWTLKDTVKPSDLNDIGNEINSLKGPDYSKWTSSASKVNNNWTSVCYGNGLFVAVADSGTGDRVMTSPDGVNWTARKSTSDDNWRSVCYGNGLFVAVSSTSGTVMTSPDGINWTAQKCVVGQWKSVCYGNGLFVAVANSGPSDRVMTSSDGVNWTVRSAAVANSWNSVCYGNGIFVAVATSGTDDRVMTSPDGINWITRKSAANNYWNTVCYGNGMFVAVADNIADYQVMTSPDGINWMSRRSAAGSQWKSVCYGNGLFVAVAYSSSELIMTSPDGINWTCKSSPPGLNLWSVCYGNGLFVAINNDGKDNRVMTSGSVGAAVRASNVFLDSKAVAEKDIQSAIESLNAKTSSLSDIVDNIHIPPASLTEAGIVQLSNETNGTRETVAATEKAVKDAALGAKSYTDQQIGLVTETGIPKLVSYPLKVTATADNQKVFEIPLDLFDANTDTLLISINRAVLDSTQYTVTNTVRNEDGKVTQRAKITLLSGVAATSEVTMLVLKNVPIGPEGAINGAVLAVDSVPINRVIGLQDQIQNINRWGAL
ncbi:phage tail protein [Paenibacillus azoreducens]|uniref:Uncharacterized protein n=1 Tax=Paenibacillus azoreducens TaxID=116718 RepID=A0A919YB98_9BACL|nr:phage tail protein [Paenibacillus azoreducens]GIO47249.1 hypothetical protein J34TS1_20140 [Paenibacillus azoreducens]